MADGRGAGHSLYAGLRVTAMRRPGGDDVLVSLAAKQVAWGWDQWETVVPVRRLFGADIGSTPEMMRALGHWLIAQAGEVEHDL